MSLGLSYDRELGTFRVSNCNQIEKLAEMIAEILNVDEVAFAQSCIMCRREFPCTECKYIESCATKNLPFECVCTRCLEEGKIPEEKL